jgi:DNA-binding CsgD family transcriptional regulator
MIGPADADGEVRAGSGGDAGEVHADIGHPLEPDRTAVHIRPTPATGAFAFGAILDAVSAPAGYEPLVFTAHGLSDRLSSWALRDLMTALDDLLALSPGPLVVHDADLLDAHSIAALDVLRSRRGAAQVRMTARSRRPSDHEAVGEGIGPPMSPLQRQVLRIIACSDIALSVSEIARVAATPPAAARDAVEDALVRGILARRGEMLSFSVAESRERHARLPDALRAALLRDIAHVIDGRLPDGVPRGEMGLAAGRSDIGALLSAMAHARHDDAAAAADYGMAAMDAVADAAREEGTRLALARDLLPLLWRVGREDDARRVARRLFAREGRVEAEGVMLLWLARLEQRPARAAELARAGRSLPGASAALHAELSAELFHALVFARQDEEAAALAPSALAEAVEIGDPDTVARLQTARSVQFFDAADYAASEEWIERAHRSASGRTPPLAAVVWRPYVQAVLGGDPQAAITRIDARLRVPVGDTTRGGEPVLRATRAAALVAAGRLAEAADELVRVQDTDAAEHDGFTAAGMTRRLTQSVAVMLAVHRGDMDGVALRARISDEPSTPPAEQRAMLFLLEPLSRGARPSGLTEQPGSRWIDPAIEVDLVAALLARGQRDMAETIASAARRRADAGHPLPRVLADHLTGLVRADPESLRGAERGWARRGRPLLAVLARVDRLAVDAASASAARRLRAGVERLVALGADRDAARVRWILRAHGHEMEGADDTGLTPMQSRVVDGALRGRSVPQIASDLGVSPHTVTTHMRHVYTKLGLRSRAELEAWALR